VQARGAICPDLRRDKTVLHDEVCMHLLACREPLEYAMYNRPITTKICGSACICLHLLEQHLRMTQVDMPYHALLCIHELSDGMHDVPSRSIMAMCVIAIARQYVGILDLSTRW